MVGPLGPSELVVIGGLLVLLFGARRLPELGRSFGQGLREFRKSVGGALEDEGGAARKAPASGIPDAGDEA